MLITARLIPGLFFIPELRPGVNGCTLSILIIMKVGVIHLNLMMGLLSQCWWNRSKSRPSEMNVKHGKEYLDRQSLQVSSHPSHLTANSNRAVGQEEAMSNLNLLV